MEMMSPRERNGVLREKVCEREEEYSGVTQHPPSAPPPFGDEAASHPTLSPQLPACLPAAAAV